MTRGPCTPALYSFINKGKQSLGSLKAALHLTQSILGSSVGKKQHEPLMRALVLQEFGAGLLILTIGLGGTICKRPQDS